MSAPAIIANTQKQNFPLSAYLSQKEICLGPVEAIPMGEGRAYKVGAHSIAVFRLRGGKLKALENECPHRGGPLSEGIVGAGTVLCPFHAWKFDLANGECHTEPCTIQTYTVREENGDLFLKLP